MRKLVLVAHTSLDGFVAGEKGEFDQFNPSPENLEFVCSLTDAADAAIFGRISYQLLESDWPTVRDKPNVSDSQIKYSNWYNDARKIVISKSLAKENLPNTTIISENIADEILAIKKQNGKDILMFGSPAAFQTLTKLNLVDEYWLIVYPAVFGKGILLFSHDDTPKKLKLMNTKHLSNGEIAVHYKIDSSV